MKLTGQEHYCHHRQKCKREPLAVINYGIATYIEEMPELRFPDLSEYIPEPVKETVCNKKTYENKCDQLDHRLERHSKDETAVPFGRVKPPGAEHNRKYAKDEGDERSYEMASGSVTRHDSECVNNGLYLET